MGRALHKNTQKPDGTTDDAWMGYVCGHCETKVSGAVVARFYDGRTYWLMCPECQKGSVMTFGDIYPGVSFGPTLQGLPPDVAESYEEARQCMSVNAFTAAELICRKILMHVAADKGAKEGMAFADYLTHLENNGFITPPMKKWVDLIRKHGNESTHKLIPPDKARAESTVMLTAELLRIVYEMEHMAAKYIPSSSKA
jgi:hypothetical protein